MSNFHLRATRLPAKAVAKAGSNLFFVFFIYLFCCCSLQSQVIDTDTSDVIIRKINKEKPLEFSISDVVMKMDKEKTKHVFRVDLDISSTTALKLDVTDSTGQVIMYLINDQTLRSGVYRVKWEMTKCKNDDCDYPPGKYLCSFETDQFIYQKDFYIK